MSNQSNGIVKWYNAEKAYGFITTEDGRDVFVHRTAIADNGRTRLVGGQGVTLEIKESAKGLEAADVQVVADVEEQPLRSRAVGRSDSPRRAREPYRGDVPDTPVLATVLRIDPTGRFMFVRADNEGFDVYVHSSLFAHSSSLNEGDQVRIVVEQSDRGPRASSLEII